jgi:hypothetical protein
LADIRAITLAKEVVSRWPDFRSARDKVFEVYSAAYRTVYLETQKAAQETEAAIRSSSAFTQAPKDQRESIVLRVFGPGGVCHFGLLEVGTLPALLSATAKTSIAALAQAGKALPIHRAEVEASLRALKSPPPPQKPDQKIFTWHPASSLAGRRFTHEAEVDSALNEVGEDLKKRIREGYTIDVP